MIKSNVLHEIYTIASIDLKMKLFPFTGCRKIKGYLPRCIHTHPLLFKRDSSIYITIAGRRNKFMQIGSCIIREYMDDDFPPFSRMRDFSFLGRN